jgi:hypothetical protein
MNKQIIKKGGKAAFVVIPIEEWRRIEATWRIAPIRRRCARP